MNSKRTFSGSYTADRIIFGALLLLVVCSALRLRVYYRSAQVGPTQVELAAVDSAGLRTSLGVPPAIQGRKLRFTLAGIAAFANTTQAQMLVPPSGHLEWTLRYSLASRWLTTPQTRVVTSGR